MVRNATNSGLACYETLHSNPEDTLRAEQARLERERRAATDAIGQQLEQIRPARERIEELRNRLLVELNLKSPDGLVEYLERLRDMGEEQRAQLKLKRNAQLMTAAEVNDMIDVLRKLDRVPKEHWEETSVPGLLSMRGDMETWHLTSDDADVLLSRVEDFSESVRVYVRITDRFPDVPHERIVEAQAAENVEQKRVTQAAQGFVRTRAGEKLGPFHRVFGPDEGRHSVSNQDIYKEVEGALLDVIREGRDVFIMGYGVSGAGKTYTLLGNDEEDGIAQQFLRQAANDDNVESIGICVKELYGITPSLNPTLQDALMHGAIYEYAPRSYVKQVSAHWGALHTTSAYQQGSAYVWAQDVICGGTQFERRKSREHTKWNEPLTYPVNRDNNSGPLIIRRDVLSDASPATFEEKQEWTVVRTSAPRSEVDEVLHVAELYNTAALDGEEKKKSGARVTDLQMALSVDAFKFVDIFRRNTSSVSRQSVVRNFQSVYRKVQELRKCRSFGLRKNGDVRYANKTVGTYNNMNQTLTVEMDELIKIIRAKWPDVGFKNENTSQWKAKLSKVGHLNQYVMGAHGDEGFTLSGDGGRIVWPRIMQRRMASTAEDVPASEALRTFEHEKWTPNNPSSSRGNLFLLLRIRTTSGKSAILTVADFAGVEEPANIAKSVWDADRSSRRRRPADMGLFLRELEYHPPYTYLQGGIDQWMVPRKGTTAEETKSGQVRGSSLPPVRAQQSSDLAPLRNADFPFSSDNFRTIREGAFIDTALRHLRYFLRKSNGTSSWCSMHDTATPEWAHNPAFYWSPETKQLDTTKPVRDNTSMKSNEVIRVWDDFVPTLAKQDVITTKGSSGWALRSSVPSPVGTVMTRPFLWDASIWAQRMVGSSSARARSAPDFFRDLWDAVSDRQLFELSHARNWYRWWKTLDKNNFTRAPEPTRKAILLIELMDAVTNRRTLFPSVRSRKSPKIIIMNLLRDDGDKSGARTQAVYNSVRYAHSLRVGRTAEDVVDRQGETKREPFPLMKVDDVPLVSNKLLAAVMSIDTSSSRSSNISTAVKERRYFRTRWNVLLNKLLTTADTKNLVNRVRNVAPAATINPSQKRLEAARAQIQAALDTIPDKEQRARLKQILCGKKKKGTTAARRSSSPSRK